MPADPVNLEHVGPDLCQYPLDLAYWLFVAAVGVGICFRRRQRVPIQLSVRRQRQRFKPDIRRWHHILGQLLRQVAPQRPRCRHTLILISNLCACVVRNQPLVSSGILACEHNRVMHASVLRQRRFDLLQLDSEASNLHLGIAAAEKRDRPVGQPLAQVPRPVHPRPGFSRERVLRKALCSQF